MSFDWNGTVAVVTGGAGGIGRALAARVASEGARVAVVDLDASVAAETAASLPGGGAIGVGCDVGDRISVEAMVSDVEGRLGPIGAYFSNAGVLKGTDIGEDDDWEMSWRVHGMAHVHAARAVIPGMISRGSGVFVITASAAGLLMTMQSATYTVTKHASVAFAEWLGVNYGGADVQIHCLCPQGVRTAMVSQDPRGEAEVSSAGEIIEPSVVADVVMDAVAANRFLVLPHPEVHKYEAFKVEDRDRWLAGMRRALSRIRAS